MKSAGLPTFQTTTAASSASNIENNGPAKATMILSSGVIGGSGCVVFFAAFQRFHRRHLRQRDEAAGGNPAEAVLHAVDFLFPDRLAEPDLETVDLQAAPFRRPEVAEFVNEDDDVENRQHDGNQQDHLENGGKSGHGWLKNFGNLALPDLPASSLNLH